MNMNDLRKENLDGLKKRLILLYRERFKILLEKTSGAEFNKNHLLKKVRRDIARVLTLSMEFKKKI